MDFIEPISDDEMVATFIQGEIDSVRFGDLYRQGLEQLHASRAELVDHPDLSDKDANDNRRRLLRDVRGYGGDNFLFRGWPSAVDWWRVRVRLAELATCRYARFHTWLDLSKNSSLVADGAANEDTTGPVGKANIHINAVTALVRSGDRLPALILAGRGREGPFVLVEGHTRATAYVRAGEPDTIECLIGLCQQIDDWLFWGQP